MAEKCFCDKLERNFCKILTIPASQGQKGGYQKNGFWASPDPSITSNILFWAKYRRPLRKYREPLAFKTTLFSNNLYRVIGQSAVLILILNPQFCNRNSSDILYKYPCFQATMFQLLRRQSVGEINLQDVANERWSAFNNFERKVDNETIMKGRKGIVGDILPGLV